MLLKEKGVMKNRNSYFEISFLVLLFLISVLVYFVFVTDKLTVEEYENVYTIYTEINAVDETGRSDFYINNVLKVLDKSTVLTNLRRDSLKYTLLVSDTMMGMLTDESEVDNALSYLSRCNLDFGVFKNLEFNTKYFEIQKEILNKLNVGDYNVEDVLLKSYDLVEKEQNFLLGVRQYNIIFIVCYVLLYIITGYVWVRKKGGVKNARNKE